MDGIFLDVPGVTGIADDMVIYGRSNLEHDKHLINFLEVCRKNTLTLNPYYTQSIEEIMAKFHGMTRFTIADFNKGYWMVELDPESRKYTTMALGHW